MNDLRIRDVAEGLIPPFPTLIPIDVQRYNSAGAVDGQEFTRWNTAPQPGLPVLVQMDPRATLDVGREFLLAGYTNELPVADVDAQLGMEALRAYTSVPR